MRNASHFFLTVTLLTESYLELANLFPYSDAIMPKFRARKSPFPLWSQFYATAQLGIYGM